MTERWARIGEIFDAALREPLERRAAFLERACGGDGDLEADVRSLLASHEEAGGFLETGKRPQHMTWTDPHGIPEAGQTIGSWKVVRALAEGGMGIVFLVERRDGQFQQRGALKFIRQGLATDEMVRRFRRERQILASLDHPNVARLLDGGTTPEGLPWLVMEYVDGVPLYEWCSERAPTLRERLRLFLGLCGAVEAAHRRLILHRDIKPSNVLVTPEGTPRLLDFGVAKIFSRDGIVPETDLTTLRAPLTPEYASPEQLRGDEVTTSTDVYSMGVLLYELITGVRPYPTRAEGAAELVRSVLEKDPVRPSTAAGGTGAAAASGTERAPATRNLPSPPTGGSGSLSRALSGDLDNIVLKALSKETTRRYGSIEELAADLKRHLDGRPVDARPSTWTYRTSKFVRRNRVAVTMGVVATITILTAAAFSFWSATEARQERALAERRLRDVAAMANTVLWDVSEELSKIPGTTPSREKVLDTATRYLNGIAQEGVRDTALVRTLADAFDKLGTVQGQAWSANVGRSQEAYRSLRKAYELREQLLASDPAHEEYAVDVAVSATKLCNYGREHGKIEEAARMSARASELMATLRAAHPDVRRYRINTPRMLHNDGLTRIEAGDVEGGLAQIQRGIVEFASLADWEPSEPAHRLALAQATTGYAEALVLRPGNADSALAVLARAGDILSALLAEEPGDPELLRRVGAVHYDTGRILLLQKNDVAGALRAAEASAAITAAARARDPGNEDAIVSDLIGQTLLGHVHAASGSVLEARRILSPLVPELERRARADTTDVRFPRQLVEAQLALGETEIAMAKSGPGRGMHWSRARASLLAAKREADALLAREGPWMLSREELDAIAKGLAECRKPLGIRSAFLDGYPDTVSNAGDLSR